MIVPFRQGIVQYSSINNIQQFLSQNGVNINLNANPTPVIVTAAQLDTDYEIIESSSISAAWTLSATNINCWLYWDINIVTAVRTFGYTLVKPIFGPITPLNPANDQHWFNTTNFTMNVFSSTTNQWSQVIRVFAAQYNNGIFTSISVGSSTQSFVGTQVGIDTNGTNIGPIVYDNNGSPVRRANGTFFTSVTSFFTATSDIVSQHLNNTNIVVQATENVTIGSIVVLLPGHQIRFATYADIGNQIIGLANETILSGNAGTISLRGEIQFSEWDWGSNNTGQELWVDADGNLTSTNLGIVSAVDYMYIQPPIARVINNTTILFDPPLSSTIASSSNSVSPATSGGMSSSVQSYSSVSTLGSVYLTLNPEDATIPIAVGTNDPRMTNARTPLPHVQPASTITVNPIGTTVPNATDLQSLLATVAYTSGFVMNGNITIPAGNTINVLNTPTNPTDVVNKQYVDNAISATKEQFDSVLVPVQQIGLIASVPVGDNAPFTYTHKFLVQLISEVDNLAMSFELIAMVKNINQTYMSKYAVLGDSIPANFQVQANASEMNIIYTNTSDYAVTVNIQQLF